MMVDPNSAKFISSLVKSLQMFCHGYMEFEDNIEIIGHINLRIDNRQKLDYIVNEQVSKQGQESTCFQSNSYHSLPPKSHERDQQAGSRCEDLPLDSSMAVLAGTRVQVDLSGPSPVTRSTFSSYPDGFLSPMGNSQGSDSQAQSLDTEQASASSGLKELLWAAQNQVVNHSHTSEKSSKQTGVVDSARAESSMSMAVSSDGDGQQQSVARLLQDIVIKAEPGSFSSPEKQGDCVGAHGLMESSSLPAVSEGSLTEAHTLSSSLTSSSTFTQQSISFRSSPGNLDMSLGSGRREAGHTGTGSEGTAPVALPNSGSSSCPLNTARHSAGCVTDTRVDQSLQRWLPPVSRIHQNSSTRYSTLRRHSSRVCAFSKPSCGTPNSQDVRPLSVANCQVMRLPTLASCQDVCSTSVINSQEMRPPSVSNSGVWWCSQCSKAFRCRDLLTMHMQFVHNRGTGHTSCTTDSMATAVTSSAHTVASSVTQESHDPMESSLMSQGLFNEMDADLFHAESKVNFSCSEFSQTSRTQYSDREVKAFTSHGQNDWLQDTQPAVNCMINTTSQFSDSSQMPLSGQHGSWTTSNLYNIHSSPGDAINSSCANFPYGVGAPQCRMSQSNHPYSLATRGSRMVPRLSGLAARRPPSTGRRCRHCHKILHFLSNVQFLEHEQSCTKEGVGLGCSQCGRHFASKVALKDHVDSMHTRKGFQCRACGLVFKWRTYVYQHRYKCPAYRVKREPL